MGMAASQARLLSLTARIHDVEFKAQSIQNAKINLATQSDEVYQEYLEALDATTLTINSINVNTGATSLVAATFNNLCSRKKVTPADGSNYILLNSRGMLVVEDEIEDGYYRFTQGQLSDPYQFALFMLNNGNVNHFANLDPNDPTLYMKDVVEQEELAQYQALRNAGNSTDTLDSLYNRLNELALKYATDPSDVRDIYDTNVLNSQNTDQAREDQAEYKETLAAFKKELYRLCGKDIYNTFEQLDSPQEPYNQELFDYYVGIFKQIQAFGGCVSIEEYNGPSADADAANNSEWLQSMIKSGQFTIEVVKTNKRTGEITYDTTAPSSDISLSYTNTTSIDNTALKKAEAKYEHDLKQIDKKDKAFDMDLSKLETQRSALTTQLESLKTVIDENVERSFGIFS